MNPLKAINWGYTIRFIFDSFIYIACISSLIWIWFILTLPQSNPEVEVKIKSVVLSKNDPCDLCKLKNVYSDQCPEENPKIEWQEFMVTFYCPCKRCIDPKFQDGKTASGKWNKFGYAASSKYLKFGTRIMFKDPILGKNIFVIQDRGRLVRRRNHIDIFIPYNKGGHNKAIEFGRQKLKGRVLN